MKRPAGKGGGLTRLAAVADVIRCQLGRHRVPGPGLACTEVSLDKADPVTRFVDVPAGLAGPVVWMDLDPSGKQSKYLLRPGDTLLSCRGARATLARAGLVLDPGGPAVAGQSLFIVRARAVDPLWLHYWLSRPAVREALSRRAADTLTPSRSEGGRLFSVNASVVQSLGLPEPGHGALAALHARHAEALRLHGRMKEAGQALREVRDGLETVFEADEDAPGTRP
jgi:hypothetical protein